VLKRYNAQFLGVPLARQKELATFNEEVNELRKKYIQQQSVTAPAPTKCDDFPSKPVNRWDAYLSKIKQQLADPRSPLYDDRHRCRPKREFPKSKDERLRRVESFALQLGKEQLKRRQYLAQMAEDMAERAITKENLEDKVSAAVENPTNFNIPIDTLIDRQQKLKRNLARWKFSTDKNLRVCKKSPIVVT
jgi:hypothetical protein